MMSFSSFKIPENGRVRQSLFAEPSEIVRTMYPIDAGPQIWGLQVKDKYIPTLRPWKANSVTNLRVTKVLYNACLISGDLGLETVLVRTDKLGFRGELGHHVKKALSIMTTDKIYYDRIENSIMLSICPRDLLTTLGLIHIRWICDFIDIRDVLARMKSFGHCSDLPRDSDVNGPEWQLVKEVAVVLFLEELGVLEGSFIRRLRELGLVEGDSWVW